MTVQSESALVIDHSQWRELMLSMYRCDRAIGNLREKRLTRANADELTRATLNLMSALRLMRNAQRFSQAGDNGDD